MVNCPLCSGPISAGVITVEGIDYHPKCFDCKRCAIPLNLKNYEKIKGKFYCKDCVNSHPDLVAEKKAMGAAAKEAPKEEPQPASSCVMM